MTTSSHRSIGLGLTNFSFDAFSGRQLAAALFLLAWLALLAAAMGCAIGGMWLMMMVGGWWFLAGVALVFIVAPVVLIAGLMIVRMLLEVGVAIIDLAEQGRTTP